ncbi:MAG TPA: sulfotransferase family 2 domain-containing protein [Thermoanaerobaculia bacterium]|nr:sulfotransferase family 2 domain-containing protein [Thermoanaerobaculia bacterium]
MIVSHRHRYLFVELPHTGSTAISRELRTFYDGEDILRKHFYLEDFLRHARPEERGYFTFSGIRNPLDEAVSVYLKYKANHSSHFTDPTERVENGGWVTPSHLKRFRFIQQGADFPAYFRRFYRLPYDNWSSLSHARMDHVLRFERLQEDFAELLRRLGIEPVRPLPVLNRTGQKSGFLSYYTPDIRRRAQWIFGPFLKRWGYELPAEWGLPPASPMDELAYRATVAAKNLYRRRIDSLRRDRWIAARAAHREALAAAAAAQPPTQRAQMTQAPMTGSSTLDQS